jgi:prolyl-tRNA synthetase
VRWEKTTRPFLRSREILWQEGHTMHETADEAINETQKMLHIYEDFQRNYLALPVIVGRKTEKEKFAGAEATYTLEAMMYNGFALQNGTSHYFGQGFAKAFDIQFLNKEQKLEYPYQTSWGVTTRMIGAIIMTHGDDRGLVLPPKIAPYKVNIIPIGKDENIYNKALEIKQELENDNITCTIDNTDKTPGFKFAESEVKGYPIRIEIGKRDLENNEVTLVRRDTLEKSATSINNVTKMVKELLDDIQDNLYNKALIRRDSMIYEAKTKEEFMDIASNKPGFIKINWCGNTECEDKIKEETGLKSRCIIEGVPADGVCCYCGKPGKYKIYFGKQY